MEKPELPNFLPEKYTDLAGSKPVERAVQQAKSRGEETPHGKSERVDAYLARLERLLLDPEKVGRKTKKRMGADERPRALFLLREMVMNKYVRPHKETMAEGAARVEERAARELGIEAHYGAEELAERGEIAIEDLEKSLDNWIKYLSDMNESYPTWFRYYAFRNILYLGDYDKDKGEFTKRSQGTARLFPEIDRGALAYVEEMIEAAKDTHALERLQKAQKAAGTPEGGLLTKEKAEAFSKLSFAKQYAEGMKQAGEITPEMREETKGKWVKYGKGTDPTALWASLQNKGTAWCTKGFGTAEVQLQGGDFYVYYTLDNLGKPSIPRIAIRMQGDAIFEVRGVADTAQNLEGNMANIAETKMNELPGAEKYRNASADMKQLTAIEKKVRNKESLTRDDLLFLYEINAPIEGFGYQKDPRIAEIRNTRNPHEDVPIVFDCASNAIAWKREDVTENTKAYIGKLFPGIFQTNIEHIATSFPEGNIQKYDIEIGGKTKSELIAEMKAKNIYLPDYAKDLLKNPDFVTLRGGEHIALVRLAVKDLGFSGGATTDEIYQKAMEWGLELCPAEVGPQLRLQYHGNDWMVVAMKQITDRGSRPSIFYLRRHGGELALSAWSAGPSCRWFASHEFVFCLRKGT